MIKLLRQLFYTGIYCGLTFGSAFAQPQPSSLLPTVSQDALQAILQFYQYDKNLPPSSRIVIKQSLSDGTREKIVFAGLQNTSVPSYLALPKVGKAPYPVVFLIDGIGGSKDRWFQDDNWPKGGLVAKALLQAGFAVMSLDAVYHGERAAESNFSGPPWPLTYPYAARPMVVQTAIEYRQAIDYLSTRIDIDTTRIGMLGLSLGGLITFALTSVEPRIKTAVAGLTPIHPFLDPKFFSFAAPTFASSVRVGSLLMFMGNRDGFYSMDEARQLYNRIPIQQKEFVEYDTEHIPPAEYVQKVRDWFKQRL